MDVVIVHGFAEPLLSGCAFIYTLPLFFAYIQTSANVLRLKLHLLRAQPPHSESDYLCTKNSL